jgi:AGZA family xanthine/uracil permease-like MFS transporter
MLSKYFEFEKHKTNFRKEIFGGVTTFLTMSYIIIVNPGILQNAGIPIGPSTVATIIAALVGTMIMALYAKRPFAVAPYMGENAFIAFTVVLGLGYTWQAGLAAVFVGGVLFVILTAFKLRSWFSKAIPRNLKYAFVVGIGLFLTFIGLVDTGIVVKSAVVPVQVGTLTSPEVLLAIFSFVLMAVMIARKTSGAIMVGILITTVLAFSLKALGVSMPDVSFPQGIVSLPPSIEPIFFKLDFATVFTIGFFPILLTVFLMDFVDTIGTLIGVSARAGFLDENGNLPEIEKPMMADAIATVIGAACGTTTTGAYIESAAGIQEGARTGFASLITAALFGLALFFTPLLTAIPKCAYGPALIIVGILMIDSVKNIDFSDITELTPAFAVIVLMCFTYNLGVGITAGFVLYPMIKLFTGRAKEVNLGTWILGAVSLLFYIFYPYSTGG